MSANTIKHMQTYLKAININTLWTLERPPFRLCMLIKCRDYVNNTLVIETTTSEVTK